MQIRRLTKQDAIAVSDLAIRSKAHWGYSVEEMNVFRNELTMTGADIESRIAFGMEFDRRELVAFYTALVTNRSAEIEHLFVDPKHLGCGIGSALVDHAKTQCHSLGVREINVLSDPNAAGFYKKLGATLVRQIPSSIPGRTIPLFRIDL